MRTVDAVNASLHLSRNPEGVKQVAAADWLVITKTDLADPAQVTAVRDELGRINPSAGTLDALHDQIDPDSLLAPGRFESKPHLAMQATAGGYLGELRRHSDQVASLSIALDEPLD